MSQHRVLFNEYDSLDRNTRPLREVVAYLDAEGVPVCANALYRRVTYRTMTSGHGTLYQMSDKDESIPQGSLQRRPGRPRTSRSEPGRRGGGGCGVSDGSEVPSSDRPPLPRDVHRAQRLAAVGAPTPLVITPDYRDEATTVPSVPTEPPTRSREAPRRPAREAAVHPRNPFDAYGERSSSRPYALRLPDAIDLALRQIAAEERTHPLRIIDRILHDHLKRTGRLPPPDSA